MTTHDLAPDQMLELKQEILCQAYDHYGLEPSYGELAAADDLPDWMVHTVFGDVDFTDDDFYGEYSPCTVHN